MKMGKVARQKTPTDSLLILFLVLCQELRDFCGFSKVSDAPLFSRFKTTFEPYIEQMFHKMVDLTEPICHLIDSSLADVLTFDTSGIELYVTENNPKTLNSLIKKPKAYYKDNPDVGPYRMAYGLMPSQAASCPDAKQQYINGHFCYADKFAILTNGLGIIRHIAFLDDDFKRAHPEMPVEKNQILRTRTSLSVTPLPFIPSWPTTSLSTLSFHRILFSGTLLLTPSKPMAS